VDTSAGHRPSYVPRVPIGPHPDNWPVNSRDGWTSQPPADVLQHVNAVRPLAEVDPDDQSKVAPRRRRRRWPPGPSLLALITLLAIAACGGAANRPAPARHSRPPTVRKGRTARQRRTIRVRSGPTLKRFDLVRPAGLIRLLRVTVPHGTRAQVTGDIPDLAGVAISIPHRGSSSETCLTHGAVDVCTQAEEACPMPAASWQFRLRKLSGPAGAIRVEFLVAPPRTQ
jgi:hypothetical protein